MDSVDLAVLRRARDWMREGHEVALYTVVETWGSAPRPVGSLLALRGDGRIEGSVSGGCIEDDLLARLPLSRTDGPVCGLITYGVSKEESARFGLPCGGTLRLVQEPLSTAQWIDELLERCASHQRVVRELDLISGAVSLRSAARDECFAFDGATLSAPFGPGWRILMIGAGQLSRYAAELARGLGFEVLICDPREAYSQDWPVEGVRFVPGMPDDAVLAIEPDAHTAIVALTHDPRLDDMALLTALRSPAFYVGALGSRANSDKRQQRLLSLGLNARDVERLHGPIGLPIGSRTPAEIALSMMAEVVAEKNALLNPRSGPQTAARRCA
ncbi:XdhC family protein [Stutzerimonas azotifigens]|uniref:XdhC family protein n=1 Tax=Stutzerimonas azotifigens TaxID=291995 RepID=A0ABR5YV54_9GAMM|nr:XdhC family protein [Stutzerimonas azotifigens]MBA1271814.1 XdhC family protein [Stutzerimonas azotifigens]